MHFVFCIVFFVPIVSCTVDLKVQHLQFVADHLQMEECKKLVSALHQKTFEIIEPLNESEVPDKPCLSLLMTWERTEGYGKTFNDLALRLTEIGRNDISDRLAKSIYEGESEEVDRLFLSDPYKKKIPKDDFLLDEKKKSKKKKTESPDKDGFSNWQIASIVLGSITAACLILFAIYYLLGSLIARNLKEVCPNFLVSWFGMVCSLIRHGFQTTKRKFMKEVVGAKEHSTIPRRRVMEMNRNLNNYLNGHWPEAAMYFEEVMKNFDIYHNKA